MKDVDRCKCEGITEGFAKITVAKNSGGKIIGATVVGPNAGSMISELTICIQVRDIPFTRLVFDNPFKNAPLDEHPCTRCPWGL